MEKPIIIITGCGSSATKYMTKFFKRAKVDIGHENFHSDGISSWYIAPTFKDLSLIPPHRGSKASDMDIIYEKKRPYIVLHQIRHPLKTISTFQRANEDTWAFVSHILGFDHPPRWNKKRCTKEEDEYRLHCCMRYWLEWNKIAWGEACYSYRIENLPVVFDHIMDLIERPELKEEKIKQFMLNESKEINSRRFRYEKKTWEDLLHLDYDLTKQIITQAMIYGYSAKELFGEDEKTSII